MAELTSIPKDELETSKARVASLTGELAAATEELAKERELRRLAEAETAKEREFTRALLDSMPDGVVACDATGELALFNRVAREWHGADPTQLPPEGWARHYGILCADGTTPMPADGVPLARAWRGEAVVDSGMAIAAAGRPVRLVQANGSAIVDGAGTRLGAVVVMRDVTELRRVEEELRRTNLELESRVFERTAELQKQYATMIGIIDSADAPIFSVDRRYRYTSFNRRHADAMKALYGTEIKLGQSLLEAMTVEQDRTSAQRHLDRALAGEKLTEEAFSGEDLRSLRYFAVSHCPIRSATGEIIGAAVLAHDLTDRRRAEESLKESERKYRDVFDNALDALYLLDVLEDGRFRTVEVNPALEKLTGIPRSVSVGRTQEEVVAEEAARIVNQKYTRCVRERRPIEEEVALDLPAGRRYFQSTLIPAAGADGRITRIVGISRDVTERKRHDAINLARIHLLQSAATRDMDALLEETLNEAESLSGSAIGFFHFVDEDQIGLSLQNWSTRTKAEFCRAEGKGRHYPLAEAGVWVDCVRQRKPVIHNDYASVPHRKGLPEGHAALVRELVVPVMRGDKVKAILGVGNKPVDYNDNDIEAVSLLADLAWEICQRKHAETELARVNRALRMLSDSNQMLIRTADETALLDEVCRIAVEVGGYRMAWVAYSQQDDTGRLRPMACAAQGGDHATTLAWAEGQCDAVAVALGKGKPFLARNLADDDTVSPCQQDARQRGYQSVLVLPLFVEGRAFGVLGIYAAEADAFETREIDILSELTSDLAFGITVLRTQARRDLAVEELGRSEEKYRTLIQRIQAAVVVHGADMRIVMSNAMAQDLLGLTEEQLLGKAGTDESWEFFHEDGSALLPQEYPAAQVLATGRESRDQVARVHRPGRSDDVWVLVNAVPVLGGQHEVTQVIVTFTNITRRKRVEESLRERESFIRNVLDSVDEGIIVVDPDYRILAANRAFCATVNLPDRQVVGRKCHQMVHGLPAPCHESGEECAVRRTFEKGGAHSVAHVHKGRSGAKQYVELRAFPVTDANGIVVSAIETVNDVTERRRLEDELRQAQKMEAIGTLAGGVAHDFNNILTGIIGATALVKMSLEPDSPLQEDLDQILSVSDRAAHLTHALLAFSRKQVMTLKPVDLNAIVGSVEKLLRRLIGEDIELSTRLSLGRLTALADAGQIEQVLMNLATNARDAMPAGGTLSIATRAVTLGDDFVLTHGQGQPGNYALITVSDSGTGMSPRTLQKVFEPFFTTKEPGKGTGLGLSIVYGIVKQHGGIVDVYSEVGKGASFKVYLPLVATVDDEVTPPSVELPPGGTETLLLAEDDQTVRSTTAAILKRFGYRIVEAVDGLDAIEKFSAGGAAIDMLILDVVMPRRSGREVYEAAKAQRPDVPVLFVSGYTADIIHTKGILDEGLQFISKPANPFELLRRIREVLDGRR